MISAIVIDSLHGFPRASDAFQCGVAEQMSYVVYNLFPALHF